MSHATGDRGRIGHAGHSTSVNHLHSSNLTSGHFLGAVPRGWMLNSENTNVRGVYNQALPQPQTQPPQANVQLPTASTTVFEPVSSATQIERTSFPAKSVPSIPSPQNTPDLRTHRPLDHRNEDEHPGVNEDAFASNSEGGRVAGVATTNALAITNSGSSTSLPVVTPTSTSSTNSPIVNQNLPTQHNSNQSGTHPVTAGPDSTTSPIMNTLRGQRGIPVTAAGMNRSKSGDLSSVRHLINASPASLSSTSPVAYANVSAPAAPVSSTHINTSRSNSYPIPGQAMASHGFVPAEVAVAAAQTPESAGQGPLSILDQKMIALVAHNPPDHYGDLTYRLLFQFICIHTASPQSLQTTLAFSPSHLQGLDLLSQVLARNRNFTPEAMIFSSKYANTFGTPGIDTQLQPSIPRAKAFLERFTGRWEALRTKIYQRGYLPCAREVAEDLQSPHLVLSQAVYTNLFFQMYPQASSGFSRDGLNPFRESQYSYHIRTRQNRETNLSLESREFLMLFQAMAQRHGHLPENRFQPSLTLSHSYSTQPIQSNARPMFYNAPRVLDRRNLTLTSQRPQAAVQISNALSATMNNNPIGFFPNPGQLLPITAIPNPSRTALHQAHLCELPVQLKSPSGRTEQGVRLYSFLGCFVDKPKVISDSTVFETWSLSVSPDVYGRFAQDYAAPKANVFGRTIRQVRNGSITLHLRCIQLTDKSTPLDPAICSATATTWPENVFISINGNHLEFRRKAHHGRDMPVDITRHILIEQNELQLSYLATKRESGSSFALLFEAVNILDHATVQTLPRSIDAQTSLANITSSLKMASEDDDIIVSDPHISIDLIDPFTARICDRPVRGSTCRHRESFDLESFLQSRSCRNKDNFVQPDEWKCPLCGKDARPASLVIDHFLLQVKEKLIADGRENTKAILVKEDGSWEPKTEIAGAPASRHTTPPDGKLVTASSSSIADAEASKPANNTSTPTMTSTDVIVLDDD